MNSQLTESDKEGIVLSLAFLSIILSTASLIISFLGSITQKSFFEILALPLYIFVLSVVYVALQDIRKKYGIKNKEIYSFYIWPLLFIIPILIFIILYVLCQKCVQANMSWLLIGEMIYCLLLFFYFIVKFK